MAAPPADRLEWAYAQLDRLDRESRRFLKPHGYTIRTNHQPDIGEYEWYIRFKKSPPVLAWGMLAGDCVHSLRSRLDHLAWTLAGSDPNDRTTQFPIFTKRDQFKSNGAWRIENLEKRDQTLIKCMQPYRRGNPDTEKLAVLADLDNLDKHRTIPVVVARMGTAEFPSARTFDPGDFNDAWNFTLTGVEEDAPVLWGTLNPPDPKAKPKPKFGFHVAFGNALPVVQFQPVVSVLSGLADEVKRIVRLFEHTG